MSLTIPIIIMLFIYALACMFLIMVILIQSGDKGGGLSSLGSSNQGLSDALGATGAEKTLNAWTTGSAVAFIVLAIALSAAISGQARTAEQILPSQAPAAPLGGSAPVSTGLPGGAAGSMAIDPNNFGLELPEGMQVQNMSVTRPGGATTPLDVRPAAPEGAAPPAAVPPAAPPAEGAPAAQP